MGLTFTRSVKVGAVRFNLSGSGIGVSVGIPGLRIGTGPRGAHISGGLGGFRYRRSLEDRAKPAASPATAHVPVTPHLGDSNTLNTVEHDALDVLKLGDSSGDALLKAINEQRSKGSRWPFAAGGLTVVFLALAGNSDGWPKFLLPTIFVVCVAFAVWVYWRDKMRRLTVLFYEPDQSTGELFYYLRAGLEDAASARKLKSIANTSQYTDSKYTAGASSGLGLREASLSLGQAPGVVANVEVPIMTTPRTTLAFYPDRILAFQGKAVGAIEYADLSVSSEHVRFVEHEAVPRDATVVDRTWQYVNKSGGPDRRFKNNPEYPVCRYNKLKLSTPEGLDLQFIGSREGGFDALAAALEASASA